jgi:bacterioferritin B
MLSERFVDALNEQIAREFAAAHQYVAIGAYYDTETFPRLARFFFAQAEEERGHGMRMVNYLTERNAPVRLGDVPAPRAAFDNHVEPIRLALEQEKKVSVQIAELFSVARETGDPASEVFMQWFVEEQVEEEAAMESLLDVAERTREVPMLIEEFLVRDSKHLGEGRGPSSD